MIQKPSVPQEPRQRTKCWCSADVTIGTLTDPYCRNLDGSLHSCHEAESAPPASTSPQPMDLFCPFCGNRHVDEGEWATRPHKTHQCQFCFKEWRLFDYPTVGIAAASASSVEGQPDEIEQLAIEMGNAGYCNYAACEIFLRKAFDIGAAARAQSETVRYEYSKCLDCGFCGPLTKSEIEKHRIEKGCRGTTIGLPYCCGVHGGICPFHKFKQREATTGTAKTGVRNNPEMLAACQTAARNLFGDPRGIVGQKIYDEIFAALSETGVADLLQKGLPFIATLIDRMCGNVEGTPCDDMHPEKACPQHAWLAKVRAALPPSTATKEPK